MYNTLNTLNLLLRFFLEIPHQNVDDQMNLLVPSDSKSLVFHVILYKFL